MDLEPPIEYFGEDWSLAAAGLVIGLAFGLLAQRSRFCLRSAVIEFSRIPRDLVARTGIGHGGAMLFGAVWLAAAVYWTRRQRVPVWGWAGAIGVGLTIAAAWWATYAIGQASLDPHPIQALSFTGPSSEVLTRVLFVTAKPPTFDLGLVPGVFLGSFIAAALFGELKLEGFGGGASMRRYMVGAVAMGFGGMLAGGCAVGAGLSGAAVFTITSWVTLCSMWAAAALTDRLLDQRPSHQLDQVMPGHAVAQTPPASA